MGSHPMMVSKFRICLCTPLTKRNRLGIKHYGRKYGRGMRIKKQIVAMAESLPMPAKSVDIVFVGNRFRGCKSDLEKE
jgi:hypothetical protein